jgi:hypothetical protein
MVRGLVAILCAAAVSTACAPRQDPRAASLRERLRQETPIPHEEIAATFEVVAGMIAGKTMSAKKNGVALTVDDNQRVEVLGMLSDPVGVYDAGLERNEGHMRRGFNAPATPMMSEIDASKTLWIDVETLRPVRYDFAFSAPGFGDYSYELFFD